MTSSMPTRRLLVRWLLPAVVVVLPFSGCQCTDQIESEPWAFGGPDAYNTELLGPPPVDSGDPPGDTDDPGDISIDAWQPEDVVSDVQCEDALNDRTSLIVDDEGTTWVGFHKYRSSDCDGRPTLVVARKPVGGTWVEEDIQPHTGIFGLSSIDPGRPVVVYPDPRNRRRTEVAGSGTFRAAHRRGFENWEVHEFNIGDHVVGPRDGFDVTEDGDSFWVTFARDDGQMVRLYEGDSTQASPNWRQRSPLPIPEPQPALARGLRADSEDSVYYVYQKEQDNPQSRFGVARYDKGNDRWPATELLDEVDTQTVVHSFAITEEFRLCLANRHPSPPHLLVTCGSMSNLDKSRKHFENQRIPSRFPASITEGRDGTLYVAFHPPQNNELRLAKREPGGSWSTRTIYDRPASGVSTAIDQSGHLVLAFYTKTENDRFALKVVRERPDDL